MALNIISLGTVTFSSGATASPVFPSVADAQTILITPTTTTTSTAGISVYHIEVEHTDTGSNWVSLTSGTNVSSAKTAVQFTAVAYKRFRMASSAADNSGITIGATKQIWV